MAAPTSPQWIEVSDPLQLVKEPVVTVSMLTYNHEPYIAQAIECVVNQRTEYPFELIIAEDCSNDSTRAIALAWQRRHPQIIRVLYSDTNVGGRQNIRRVYQSRRGKYYAICEGDDYWHNPDKLQRQVSQLEQHPECVLVHGAFRRQVGNTIVPYKVSNPVMGRAFDVLLMKNTIATCTVCIRTSLSEQYGRSKFFDRNYLMADYPHWLFASQHGSIGYISDPVATYRKTPGSVINSRLDAPLRMELSAQQVRKDFIEEYGASEETCRKVLNESNRQILIQAFIAGNRGIFNEEFRWRLENHFRRKENFKILFYWLLLQLRLNRIYCRTRSDQVTNVCVLP